MEEFVARENIRRFEAQLDSCTDPDRRDTLLQLLESERQRLADAQAKKRRQAPARS